MADRYWVGGTANWDGTAGTKWSATSGGAGGASVPTSADDVFFNAASGASTVTIATGNTGAKSITCTGFTGTLTGIASITVSGNITLVTGMTYSHTGGVTIDGTATLITAGKAFSTLGINGAGITVTLGDALNTSTRTVAVTQGTFTTSASNYSITAGALISSNTNTRTISLNGSTVTLSAATPIDFLISTNLTFNGGTSQINCSNSTATLSIGGGVTFYNVRFTSTTAATTKSVTGQNTFNDLTMATSAIGLNILAFSDNQTINGQFNPGGSSNISRGFVLSNTLGTTRTLTVNTLLGSLCDYRDITIAGTASGSSQSGASDCGGNSGITFPAAKTVYWNLAGAQNWNATAWATTAIGTPSASNFPLAQDTATFTDSGAAGTVSMGALYNLPAIDASTRTSAMTLNHNNAVFAHGSYTLGSGVTISGTQSVTFLGRATATFVSAGKTITFPVIVEAPNGSLELGDAFTSNSTSGLTLTRGTFDAKTYNYTANLFSSSNTNTRTLNMGSGLWTLTGTNSNVWTTDTATNLTINQGTANILLSSNATTGRRFSSGGNYTFNKLTIGGDTSTSTTELFGSATYGELASTKTVAHTITFNGNNTVGTWSITGTSGNVVSLNSNTAATVRTLTKSGGGYLTGIDYLDIRSIAGNPTDTWYVGSNSVINTTAQNPSRNIFTTQRASNAIIVLTDTSGSATWTVPSDWNPSANSIHIIGGGGGGASGRVSGGNRAGGGGGGGGGYTRLNNQSLTIGSSILYQAGIGGITGTSGTDGASGGTTSWNSGAATAGGGGGGQATVVPSSTGGTGGTGSTYNGGNGGIGSVDTNSAVGHGGGGGGGAGGPNGAGGSGGTGFGTTASSNIAGGGGGGNGGGTNGGNASSGVGGTGGNNSSGIGGGASNTSGVVGGGGGGSVSALSVGGNGIELYGVGSGGGGGGLDDSSRSNLGGNYGGGGGGGGVTIAGISTNGGIGIQGAIIIVYTPVNNIQLAPSLYTNTQTIYSASVTSEKALSPSLYTNNQTFYSHNVVSDRTLSPQLYTNLQQFYGVVVTQPGIAQQVQGAPWWEVEKEKKRKKEQDALKNRYEEERVALLLLSKW